MVDYRVLENTLVKNRNDESYFSYDWIIKLRCFCDNCLKNMDDYDYIIDSPEFSTESVLSIKNWQLRLRLYKKPITLQIISDLESFDECRLRISVRDKNNVISFTHEFENLKKDRYYEYDELRFIEPSLIRTCNYIPGVLKLVVEIFKPVIVEPTIIKNATNNKNILKNLQQNEKLSDVMLVVGEREFRVHKIILAAQSPVFLAMFEHDMKEKVENKVIIEDVSEEVIKHVLDYLYTGSVDKEQLIDLADEILVAADKYALEDLIKVCEEILAEALNNDNAFKILKTAISYKLDSLRKAAVNFIADKIEELVETNEFKNLNSMDMVKEILLALKKNKKC